MAKIHLRRARRSRSWVSKSNSDVMTELRSKRGWHIVIVLVLAFVFITAGRYGIAELIGMSANSELDSWTKFKRTPTADESQSVATRYAWAIALADMNPAHHEGLARLDFIRATQLPTSDPLRATYLASAKAEILRAISLRPISPYSWTILLVIKHASQEYDAEFRHALHRAVELGPWEPDLLPQLADVGLSAWSVMPAEEQALIGQVFVRGMQRQQKTMLSIANAHINQCANGQTVCQ